MIDLILIFASMWAGWNFHELLGDGWRPWRHEMVWREVPYYPSRRSDPTNQEQA